MIRRFPQRTRLLLVRPRRNVGLTANDRLDLGVGSFPVKFDRAEEIPVIGHGHSRHLEFGRFFHQRLHSHRPVQQRIFGVKVQMDERIARHR